jgi:cytochrome c-type biogenesis protein CcmH/NrfG
LNPDSWNNLGVAQMWITQISGVDRRQEAQTAFAKAVDLDPLFVDAWGNLARVAHFYGDRKGEESLWLKVPSQPSHSLCFRIVS